MLWKSLGISFKEGNTSKNSQNIDGTIQFEPRENANIFKKFYFELANGVLKKLQIALIVFVAEPLKITMLIYLTVKKTNFNY